MPASIKEIFQSETWNAACQIKEGATMDNGVPSVCRSGDRPAGCWSRLWAGLKRILSEEIRRENKAGIVAYCKQLQAVNQEMGQRAEALLRHRWYYGQPITLRKVKEIAVQHFCNEDFISNFIMQPNLQNGASLESGYQKIEEALEILKLHLGPDPGENDQARSEEERNALVLLEEKIAQNQQKKSTLREASGSLLTPSGEPASKAKELKPSIYHPIPLEGLPAEFRKSVEELDQSVALFHQKVKEYKVQRSQVKDYIRRLTLMSQGLNDSNKRAEIIGRLENANKVISKKYDCCRLVLDEVQRNAQSLSTKLMQPEYDGSNQQEINNKHLMQTYIDAINHLPTEVGVSTSDLGSTFFAPLQKDLTKEKYPQKLRLQILEFFSAVDVINPDFENGVKTLLREGDYAIRGAKDLASKSKKPSCQAKTNLQNFKKGHPLYQMEAPYRVVDSGDYVHKTILEILNPEVYADKSIKWQTHDNSTPLVRGNQDEIYENACYAEIYQEKHEGKLRNAIEEMKKAISEAEECGSLMGESLKKCKVFLRACELPQIYLEHHAAAPKTLWDNGDIIDEDQEIINMISESNEYASMRSVMISYWELYFCIIPSNHKCVQILRDLKITNLSE